MRHYVEEFEAFWAAYPYRTGNPKAAARTVWLRLAKADELPPLDEILAAAKAYASHCKMTAVKPEFVAHARTWLNQKRWVDWKPEPTPPKPWDAPDWADDWDGWSEFKAWYVKRWGNAQWWKLFADVRPAGDGYTLTVPSRESEQAIDIAVASYMEKFFGRKIALVVAKDRPQQVA